MDFLPCSVKLETQEMRFVSDEGSSGIPLEVFLLFLMYRWGSVLCSKEHVCK